MTTHPIHRRGFNILLGSALAWPLITHAQQANNPFRIGYVPLGLPSNATDQSYVEAFRKGLLDVGLIENRDVTIDITWVANESDYPQAVSQLVQRGAALLVTGGSTATAAAQRHTSTIPIIFAPCWEPCRYRICSEPLTPRRQHHRLQRRSRRPERQVCAIRYRIGQAASAHRLSVAYRLAGRKKQA